MQMTMIQFMASQNLRTECVGGQWQIVRANGKVLKSKSGKMYDGYPTARAAREALERDLVAAGVLTAI